LQRFLALTLLLCALGARAADAQLDKLNTPQVVITSTFVEVTAELRKFPKWEEISGNDPAVLEHDAKSISYGAGFTIGQKLGDIPIWATLGGFYGRGLETNTTLRNGDQVHGKVQNVGLGGGVRLVPFQADRVAWFLWAMGFHEWDNGDFDVVDGESVTENRIHRTWTGDYGVGALYLLRQRVGLDFGIGYNGQFNKKNADEAFRVYVGLHFNISGIDY
jgi:hypothetical protein